MQPVICLMGPTASGKTALSLSLAKELNGEIVSVDSAMVYRAMNIGTAKPKLEERADIPHHLIDITDPCNPYSAAQFQQDAIAAIHDIISRQKQPILVGGTMLYFKALQQGLASLPSADPKVREKLSIKASEIGWPQMHAWLAEVDPESAERISPTDPQRIQRALEVFELQGKSLSQLWRDNHSSTNEFQFVNLALIPQNRSDLHSLIAQRFHQMLEIGFIAECEQLFHQPNVHADLPAIRSVGYRQMWRYLAGEYAYDEMIERAIIATRQLAKRQLTWLRSWQSLTCFDSHDPQLWSKLSSHIREVLTSTK